MDKFVYGTSDRTGEGVCCEGFWYKKVLDLAQPVRRHLHPLFAARTTAEPLFPISPSSCHQGMLAALPRLPRPGAIGPLVVRALGASASCPSALTLGPP